MRLPVVVVLFILSLLTVSISAASEEHLLKLQRRLHKELILTSERTVFYKWTDSSGNVFIADHPPVSTVAVVVRTSTINGHEVIYLKTEKETDDFEEPFNDEALNNEKETPSDPLESFNRKVFWLNDKLYFYVLKPVAKGYSLVFPEEFRVLVRNFFNNLSTPVRFINCFMQGKVEAAFKELLRFGINSTIGIGGLVDIASRFGLEQQSEDFGQTLATYGIGDGPFLMLPVLGPVTLRDALGSVVDAFADPVNYITPVEDLIWAHSYRFVNKTSLHIGDYETLKDSAIDPYTAIKDAYYQYRKEEIQK